MDVAERLAALLRPGELLAGSVGFERNIEETGPSRGVTNYWEDHGLDALEDVVYRERAIYGYLGVTDTRIIIVKTPVFGS